MKKLFLTGVLTLGVIVVSLMFFNACKKDQVLNSEDQQGKEEVIFATGCELAPADVYAKFPKSKDLDDVVMNKASYFLSCPPVGNQGSESSCTSWGTTYAGKTIQRRLAYRFSPEFVYNSLTTCPSNCSCGLWVADALNLLKSKGACTTTSMPSVTGCSVKPNAAQLSNAALYKTTSWTTISINTTNFKNNLLAGRPIIMAGPTNTAYNNLANGAVLRSFTGTNLGNHCYCIIGYDDAKNAFKFLNSWGTGWASYGYGWIDYNYLTSWVKEAYTLSN